MNGRLPAWLAFLVGLAMLYPPQALGGESFLHRGSIQSPKKMRSLQQIRVAKTVKQRWDISCGSAALATILTHHYGDKTSEAVIITSILRITDPVKIRDRGGFSLFDLKRFVQSRGYEGKGYGELTLEELVKLNAPAIVPIRAKGFDHFVVFRGIRGDRVVMSDPAFGTVTMKIDRFAGLWKGGIGFIVLPRDGRRISGGLEPRPEELLIPDGGAINRASTMSTTPLTRRGL